MTLGEDSKSYEVKVFLTLSEMRAVKKRLRKDGIDATGERFKLELNRYVNRLVKKDIDAKED